MKIDHPLVVAMFTIGKTVVGIIAVCLLGAFFISMLWGDEGAAFSLFTIGSMLLAPIALIRAIILAIKRFALDRARIRNEKSA